MNRLAHISANALIPDQLLPYVKAVSGLESIPCGACVAHIGGDQGVLAAPGLSQPELDKAIGELLKSRKLSRLTVIAEMRPAGAPENAESQNDWYWQLPLPQPKPSGKLANMLRRAAREVEIQSGSGTGAWTAAHKQMIDSFCLRKKPGEGSVFLFGQLHEYLEQAPDAVLFNAISSRDGSLAAFAIGDFTALSTAFYMFAFRSCQAPPGTADLLLGAILGEAQARGHIRLNLGLGIDPGVEFFKKKWGAEKMLPYVETSWDIKPPKSWLQRLFG